MHVQTVNLANIHPNPCRDFALRPLDDEHVAALQGSLSAHRQFTPLAARPHPTKEGAVQLIHGHALLEAMRRSGLDEAHVMTTGERTDRVMLLSLIASAGRDTDFRRVLEAVRAADALGLAPATELAHVPDISEAITTIRAADAGRFNIECAQVFTRREHLVTFRDFILRRRVYRVALDAQIELAMRCFEYLTAKDSAPGSDIPLGITERGIRDWLQRQLQGASKAAKVQRDPLKLLDDARALLTASGGAADDPRTAEAARLQALAKAEADREEVARDRAYHRRKEARC